MCCTLVVALAVGFSAPVMAQEVKFEAATVSVCQLVENPSQYHGRVVQVRGRVHPSEVDTPVTLVESTCAKSIRLDVEHRAEAHDEQSVRDFSRYLSEWRTVEATVSGRLLSGCHRPCCPKPAQNPPVGGLRREQPKTKNSAP